MAMPKRDDVLSLAYLVFEVREPDAFRALLVDVLGLTEGEASGDGCATFRMDARRARIFVRRGDADDLVAMGFEAPDKNAMWDVSMRARETAFVEEGLARDAANRFAEGLMRFEEPGGVRIEVVHGLAETGAPLDASRTPGGFVTDAKGLGHLALRADDPRESRAFFEDVLGFRYTDRIACELRGGFAVDISFLRVNARHHTIALGAGLPKHLDHFMIETAALDDLGRIYDRAFDHGVRVTRTLGRHPNDRMLSFYALTPAGFQVECGYGGREVDDATWVPTTYDRISLWGHRRPGSMKDDHVNHGAKP